MPDEGFISMGKAAAYLGVSAKTLRRWESSGKLKSLRPGVNRYFAVADLEAIRGSPRLSVRQSCRILRISTSTLRRLTDAGIVPFVREENGYRGYDPPVIDAFVQSAPYRIFMETRSLSQAIASSAVSIRDNVIPSAPVIPEVRPVRVWAPSAYAPPPDEYGKLSPHDAAHLLHISTSTLRRLTDIGLLPDQREPNGYRYYLRRDIEAVLHDARFAKFMETHLLSDLPPPLPLPVFVTVIDEPVYADRFTARIALAAVVLTIFLLSFFTKKTEEGAVLGKCRGAEATQSGCRGD